MTGEWAAPPPDVARALQDLGDLIQMFSQHPDEGVQEAVVAMLQAVDVLHRGALQRLRAFLDSRSLLGEALAHPHVALLLDLYDTREDDDERARAEAAVEAVRPYVESHGGRIEVVAADGGAVNVRLLSACESCSGSTETLGRIVEEALRTELPEYVRVDVSPPQPPRGSAHPEPTLIPVASLTVPGGSRPPQSGCGGSEGRGCSSCR